MTSRLPLEFRALCTSHTLGRHGAAVSARGSSGTPTASAWTKRHARAEWLCVFANVVVLDWASFFLI